MARAFDPAMGPGGVGQRIFGIHHRGDAARVKQRPDMGAQVVGDARLGEVGLRAERLAGDRQPPRHYLGEVQFDLRSLQ